MNVLGEEIYEKLTDTKNTKCDVDISFFAKGIYFVEIKTEQGIVRKKIIKE